MKIIYFLIIVFTFEFQDDSDFILVVSNKNDSVNLYLEDLTFYINSKKEISIEIIDKFKYEILTKMKFSDSVVYDCDSNICIGGILEIYYKRQKHISICTLDSISSDMPRNFYIKTKNDQIVFKDHKINIFTNLSSKYLVEEYLGRNGVRDYIVSQNKLKVIKD